jgi:hypothetical protein
MSFLPSLASGLATNLPMASDRIAGRDQDSPSASSSPDKVLGVWTPTECAALVMLGCSDLFVHHQMKKTRTAFALVLVAMSEEPVMSTAR